MKRGNLNPSSSTVLTRSITFPNPFATDRLKLVVEDGAVPLVVKLDVIGTDSVKKYQSDPNVSPTQFNQGE